MHSFEKRLSLVVAVFGKHEADTGMYSLYKYPRYQRIPPPPALLLRSETP